VLKWTSTCAPGETVMDPDSAHLTTGMPGVVDVLEDG